MPVYRIPLEFEAMDHVMARRLVKEMQGELTPFVMQNGAALVVDDLTVAERYWKKVSDG